MEYIRIDSVSYQDIEDFFKVIDKRISNNGKLKLELFENTATAGLLEEDAPGELPLFGLGNGIGSGIVIAELLRRILQKRFPTLTVVKLNLQNIFRMTVLKLSVDDAASNGQRKLSIFIVVTIFSLV